MFEIIDKEEQGGHRDTVIKVIGIGGAGGNAVDHMIREGVNGVDFIAANTDSQALGRSVALQRLQLGKTGLGAGAKPEAGRSAAEEERAAIAESLAGAHMVFITAGMGGGTGTGAAPIVAEVARELGVLTVAVVTKPFGFEGKRLKIAEAGIAELQKHVDSLIVILNDRLMDVLGDDVSMDDAFKAADNVLRNAVGGIAEIINFPGLVNVDFEDVRTVMGEMGMAMMGSASAAGVDRARIAAERAVASPLLEGVNLSGAKGVLVNITATRSLKMKEVNEVMNTVRAFAADDAHIIFGAVYDESIDEEIRVTVVATGLGQAQAKRQSFEVINTSATQATGTDGRFANGQSIDYSSLDQTPAVFRKGRSATVEALANSGVDRWDIPAFLRKQAD
ncbi:MAG: Cell division protein FtsZ [Candidatus Accumulibacter regalis]|jgi:cell division protein FtsZ|uniref:Cell division protein FtsZ n=1 Tax=Accumulibacter regalis TaxID=522306 RepID=A0A011QBT5_ACCRE|nr:MULTISPECIES: cell division protein FtsZ [unclassified Candidatus Accumulibacter]EXI86530.1 MAG: Cell division protein FtsZ [Candidatus Accumulibacter regalis]MQM35078.1 cell division protein FtsZ [Candidatus Accumulibacter phosphatis]MBL8369474.1 cell division protein FtsZ [Accumulibacter sp.]MBN8515205.1 cell division protein FtsZ [Accumulibacter sp.]MBO3701623.1 cell division protein FtsZ [Accumulibacter sp.]